MQEILTTLGLATSLAPKPSSTFMCRSSSAHGKDQVPCLRENSRPLSLRFPSSEDGETASLSLAQNRSLSCAPWWTQRAFIPSASVSLPSSLGTPQWRMIHTVQRHIQFKNSNLQVDADSKCAFKHTAKPADEKTNSASIAVHIPLNDERQMQLRTIQSDDKTQIRVRLHHLAKKVRSQRETLGLTLGVIQTGSQNQRNANAPTFEERSIAWTTQKTCTKFQVRILRIDVGCSNQVLGAMFFTFCHYFEKREFIVDSGASLQILSTNDLTPERTGNDSKVNGSISRNYCKWNYSYD